LGFDGVVVTDYFTVHMLAEYHHIAADESEAAVRALEAGMDIELPALRCFGAPLRQALANGRVDPALIDAAVARVLRMKFQLGLFDDPYVEPRDAGAVFDTTEQRMLARRLAEKSLVLLKNDGLLPLRKDLRAVAVIGPSADSVRLLQGDYHYPAHLEIMYGEIKDGDLSPRPAGAGINLGLHFIPTVTVLEGIRAAVSPATAVHAARGCDIVDASIDGFAAAVAAAQQAEVAIVVVGERSGLVEGCTSGESVDRADLGLPGVQQQLVEAIVATGTPVVVVLINGRPLALPWIAEHVPAIVEAWIPGEESGHAIAAVLFGDVNPAGRLPLSVPRSVGQLPVFYNHKPSGGRSHWKGSYADLPTTPLFPFGHGLSFTTFTYDNFAIDPVDIDPHGTVRISMDIRNSGDRAGEEVVQLYVHDVVASVTRPVQELKGFARIAVEPGATRRVVFELAASQLAFFDMAMRYVVEPGVIEVMVGSSSADVRLRGTFTLVGQTTEIAGRQRYTTRVSVS
jgi:beta-glucosidase